MCHKQLYYLDLMPALKDVMGALKGFYCGDNPTERTLHEGWRGSGIPGIRFHLWSTYAVLMPVGLDFFYAACG